jgi:hypothetical protein
MKAPSHPLLSLAIVATLNFFGANNSTAQVLERNNTSFGSNKSFTYSVQSTYGVTTNVNASSNLKVFADAVLNLQKDSYITNSAGKVGDGGTTATFNTSPNGTTVALTGITADNKFLIDAGTSFKASVESVTQDGNQYVGTATANATHTLTLSVNNGESSFFNTLKENFSGNP